MEGQGRSGLAAVGADVELKEATGPRDLVDWAHDIGRWESD